MDTVQWTPSNGQTDGLWITLWTTLWTTLWITHWRITAPDSLLFNLKGSSSRPSLCLHCGRRNGICSELADRSAFWPKTRRPTVAIHAANVIAHTIVKIHYQVTKANDDVRTSLLCVHVLSIWPASFFWPHYLTGFSRSNYPTGHSIAKQCAIHCIVYNSTLSPIIIDNSRKPVWSSLNSLHSLRASSRDCRVIPRPNRMEISFFFDHFLV